MNGIRQYFLLVALLSLFFNKAVAQPPLQEKRIYLVDVTASMEGKGEVETPDIFQTVKESLAETIQQIFPSHCMLFLQLSKKITCSLDRTCNQLWKERYKQSIA